MSVGGAEDGGAEDGGVSTGGGACKGRSAYASREGPACGASSGQGGPADHGASKWRGGPVDGVAAGRGAAYRLFGAMQGDGVEDRRPKRPSLPFLLIPAAAMWLAMMLAESACLGMFAGEDVWVSLLGTSSTTAWSGSLLVSALLFVLISLAVPVVFACCGRLTGAVARAVQSIPLAIAASVAAVLGFALGMVCWGGVLDSVGSIHDAEGPWIVDVTSDPSSSQYGWRSSGSARSADGVSADVRIYWDAELDPLPYGSRFVVDSNPNPIDPSSRWLFQSGISATFSIGEVEEWGWTPGVVGLLGSVRQECMEIIMGNPGEGAALLAGVVLGNASGMEGTDAEADFRTTGLTHLIAVSGGHMAVVAMLTSWVLSAARISRGRSTVVLGALICAYLVLTGMQPSAVRSCVMAVIASVSWIAGRRSGTIHVLVIAIIAILVTNPTNAFSAGFALSVAGVGALGVFLGLADAWTTGVLPRSLGRISQPVSMTLVAQAATTPISAPMFSMLSLGSPLCNLVASFPITLLLTAGMLSLMLCAVIPPVGETMVWMLCILAELLVMAVAAMAAIPYMAVPVHMDALVSALLAIAIGVALWIAWPLPSKRTMRRAVLAGAAALLTICPLIFSGRGAEVVVLDVGQGDSILVRDGSSSVLVDTGMYGSDLLDALGRNGVTSLDAVVVTHFDSDHCGALPEMRSVVQVDWVVLPEGSFELAESDSSAAETIGAAEALVGEDRVVEVACGDSITLSGSMSLEVVWPDGPVDGSGNPDSLCLLLRYGETGYADDGAGDGVADGGGDAAALTILLTGDAEAPELEEMLEAGLGQVDILKVGHHGSDDSVDAETLAGLSPSAAIISVGEQNSYGHPTRSTLEALEEAGVEVFRTDLDGDVTVELTESGAMVRCANI